MVMRASEAVPDSQGEEETKRLTIRVLEACTGTHSDVAFGALFWVIEALLDQCPDKGYAIACADHMERTGREIRKRLTS